MDRKGEEKILEKEMWEGETMSSRENSIADVLG